MTRCLHQVQRCWYDSPHLPLTFWLALDQWCRHDRSQTWPSSSAAYWHVPYHLAASGAGTSEHGRLPGPNTLPLTSSSRALRLTRSRWGWGWPLGEPAHGGWVPHRGESLQKYSARQITGLFVDWKYNQSLFIWYLYVYTKWEPIVFLIDYLIMIIDFRVIKYCIKPHCLFLSPLFLGTWHKCIPEKMVHGMNAFSWMCCVSVCCF